MTDTPRCEPPEHLRGVDGWHWVQCPEGTEQACRWRGESEKWPPYWSGFDGPPNDPEQAYGLGWRYKGVASPPAVVAGLVEALEDIALCRLPGIPDGCTVTNEQVGAFALDRARAALAAYREAGR